MVAPLGPDLDPLDHRGLVNPVGSVHPLAVDDVDPLTTPHTAEVMSR